MQKLYCLLTFSIALLLIHLSPVNAQNANLELLGELNLSAWGGGSDIWGYVDEDGNEYAVFGAVDGTSIIDITDPQNPEELHWIPGPNTIWRDMKVWGQYAYVTNEAESSQGLQIIDMSNLPEEIEVTYYDGEGDVTFGSAHNVFIDEKGYAYILGASYGVGGAIILDLNESPTNPPVVGVYNENYIHDAYVRGDTLWSSEVYAGHLAVIDIEDRSNPVVWSTINTPSNFTHNCWLDDEGDYIYTTDEVSNGYIGGYDVKDIFDMQELDRTQSSPNNGVIPHNTFVVGDYLVTSYYRDGVTIHDKTNPDNIIQVGNYDTSPLSGNGFNGCWGVYPYLPSGNIIASDMEGGLFVFAPTYVQACYLRGIVSDEESGALISNATVNILNNENEDVTNILGTYATGVRDAGTYSIEVTKAGYEPKIIDNVVLFNGEEVNLDIELTPFPSYNYLGNVVIKDTEIGVENAELSYIVELDGEQLIYNATTDASGDFVINSLIEGEYQVAVGAWGYQTILVDPLSIELDQDGEKFELELGYYDDFLLDFGWNNFGSAESGHWERVNPNGTYFGGGGGGGISNPEDDVEDDLGEICFVTGHTEEGGGVGQNDIDGGNVVLQSPLFDLTNYENPVLNYSRWFFNGGGQGATPNDELVVSITNGQEEVILETITTDDPMSSWQEQSFNIADYIEITDNMRVIFESADDVQEGLGHLVEAAVDHFRITADDITIPTGTNVEEMTNNIIKIYPNPANSIIAFESTQLLKDAQLSIFDLSGKLVHSQNFNNRISISIKTYKAGTYLYQLTKDNETLQSGQFVKQ